MNLPPAIEPAPLIVTPEARLALRRAVTAILATERITDNYTSGDVGDILAMSLIDDLDQVAMEIVNVLRTIEGLTPAILADHSERLATLITVEDPPR